jgi:GNAT superfamily N-acetyltransferase
VLDDDNPYVLVGYGTWKHVEQIGSVVQPRHIEIAWFGVHSDYQGVPYRDDWGSDASAASDASGDHPGSSSEASMPVEAPSIGETSQSDFMVADVVYAEVERFAREHPDSTEDTPITLTCHIDNARALAFYRRNGFTLIPDPKLQVLREIYYRLVR